MKTIASAGGTAARLLSLEERRAESDRLTVEWSRDLDAMGAPAE